METENDYFSTKLYETMKSKNITRQGLATLAHVNLSSLNKYLRKIRPILPGILTASSIAKALGVSLDYLTGISSTEEIKKCEITSEVLLRNLAHVIKTTQFEIKIDQDNNTISLINNDPSIFLFLIKLKRIQSSKDYNEKLEEIISFFSGYKVFNGKLIDPKLYSEFVEYIYDGFTDEDIENNPDEVNEYGVERIKELEEMQKKDSFDPLYRFQREKEK